MRFIRGISILLTVAVVAAIGFLIIGWRSEIAPDPQAASAKFAPDLIMKGAQLAAVGNCIACHTKPGEAAFAGGLPVPTPFGTLYSTNITPDRDTGIGQWTQAAFTRAMREGVDREGEHLYPAFPYDHFTWVTDDDNKALYAFLMTREPVKATAPKNQLMFPLQFRPLLAGWNLLFFREGVMQPEGSQSEEWNRGRYLAEGLGHCGACHTPRNAFGAEDKGNHFGGGEAEGWQAYAVNANSRTPVPWTADSIAFYLRNGWHELHGVSRGPMAEVTGNLGLLSDSDVHAIATYVASTMGTPSADRKTKGDKLTQAFGNGGASITTASVNVGKSPADLASHPGAVIYTAACATCHESGRAQPFGGLNFALSTAVNSPNPQNIINVAMFGLPPADGQPSAIMPAFGNAMNDQQVADLLGYLRARFSDQPAWTGLTDLVAKTRSGEHPVTVLPSDGIERAPRNVGAKEQK